MRKIKIFIGNILAWLKSVFYLIYWLLVHCVKSDFKNHIQKTGQGKSIDVIVNGPSFAKQIDEVRNDGCDKCMVNFAANSQLFWELKPIYYCVADPDFFINAANLDYYQKDIDTFIDSLKKVDWDMTFFVIYNDYKRNIRQTDLNKLPHIKFVPYHVTSFPFSFRFKKIAFWLFEKGQAMPNPMSVSIPVIMNAINSGYSYINLYGFDQDWVHNVVVDDNNRVCLQDTHFYNEKGELIPWLKNDHETFKMHEVLKTQTELFESYWFIKEYVRFLGNVKVINRSPSSLLDAFDRY